MPEPADFACAFADFAVVFDFDFGFAFVLALVLLMYPQTRLVAVCVPLGPFRLFHLAPAGHSAGERTRATHRRSSYNCSVPPSSDSTKQGTTAPKNIVLTGFMGTGKSTVGRLLAKQLKMQHVDTDQLIERRHGPIPRIFAEQGEAGFREIERELAKELATDVGFVISTGGRFMLDPHNAKLMTTGNRVFCLVADIDVIMERVMRRRSSRPMLAGPNPRVRVLELLKEREPAYAKFEAVTTDERPATQVVNEILARLNRP